MKRNNCLSVITMTLMLISLFVTGCLNADSGSKEDTVKDFLNEFFSINNQGRYDKLMEVTIASDSSSASSDGVSELPEDIQKAYENYYLPFADTASDSCIDSMQASRLPIKYDAFFAEYAVNVQVDKVTLEKVNENSYNFEILLKADQDLEQVQSPIRGKVTTLDIDRETLVDSILISN